MANLAGTLGAQGDHVAARRLKERVLEVRTRVLGEEHPDTLTSMGNLAITLRDQVEREQSLRLFRTCLGGSRKVLGDTDPDYNRIGTETEIPRREV